MGCFFAALLAGYRPNSNPTPEENATDSATTEGDMNIPGQPGFDLDRYLDEFYKHVEGGDVIRPQIDADKCTIGREMMLSVFIPVENAAGLKLVRMDREGVFEEMPYMYFNGSLAFNTDCEGLYLLLKVE